MPHEPRTSLVPFHQANPETRDAFLDGLKSRRQLDSNPPDWHCTSCGTTTPGDDILISYDVGDTPIEYCPAESCTAYGPELKPADV